MRSIARRFAAVLIVPFALGCAEEPADDATLAGDTTTAAPAATEAPAELVAAQERYTAAWNGNDPAAVGAFFTEDAVAIVGDSTWRGAAEINRGWLSHVPNVSDLVVTTTSLSPMGSDYHGTGTYTLNMTPPAGAPGAGTPVAESGRYDVMWTLAPDGQWKIKSSEVHADSAAQ